jgi:hypothetical protein
VPALAAALFWLMAFGAFVLAQVPPQSKIQRVKYSKFKESKSQRVNYLYWEEENRSTTVEGSNSQLGEEEA